MKTIPKDDEHEANSCWEKINYKTKYKAMEAAITMKEKLSEEFDAYECYYCKGWHIGHNLANKKKPLQA